MESKDILEILKNFEYENTYKKIFINGKWGIGKSFYTKQYIENKNNAIYISLFGKDKMENIQGEIIREILKKAHSKRKYLTRCKNLAKKITGSFSYKGISINSLEMKERTFIEEYGAILDKEENLIIIIDDLERKSSKVVIEDILGVIEQLSLCSKIKIVLIGDESRINDKDKEIWESFKEKVIEKEYKISKFSNDAINVLLISRLSNYISEKDLNDFVKDFINKFSVDNLRIINKGANLFLEIVSRYLENSYPDINIIILKSCMAVAIETSKESFEQIQETKENSNAESNSQENKKDITTRIEECYFNSNSPFLINKEAKLVRYVLKIYEGDHTKELIEELKSVIETSLITKRETKNIFYLNEKDIIYIISNNYNMIKNNKYSFTCLDKFLDDIYNIIYWHETFEIKYSEEILKERFKLILFRDYYKNANELSQNTISRFDIRYRHSKKLGDYIDEYNNDVEERYYTQLIEDIEKTFTEKEYDISKLKWTDIAFIQPNKEQQIEKFITKARKNNYFIADMSEEISEEAWSWIYYIWHIFYDLMKDYEYKDEFNNYINQIKGKSKLQNFRIKILQEGGSLAENEN